MPMHVKEGKTNVSEWIDKHGEATFAWPLIYSTEDGYKYGRIDTTFAYVGYVQGVGVHLFYSWDSDQYSLFKRSDKPPQGWCLRRGRFWFEQVLDVPGVVKAPAKAWRVS